jgi:DNA-binding GntR family transcriptional regulator
MVPKSNSQVVRAYTEIKRHILNNEWPAGHQAFEPELSAEFGMSRTPLREALVRLQTEGLVRLVPRRGMCVVGMSPTDVSQVYEVLAALESMAAELLAGQKPKRSVIKPMLSAVASMKRAVPSRDLEAWAAADEQFHDALLTLSGNPRLEAMGRLVKDQAQRARMTMLRLREPETLSRSSGEHWSLIEAIQNGDAQRSGRIAKEHRLHGREMIMDVLTQYKLARF